MSFIFKLSTQSTRLLFLTLFTKMKFTLAKYFKIFLNDREVADLICFFNNSLVKLVMIQGKHCSLGQTKPSVLEIALTLTFTL